MNNSVIISILLTLIILLPVGCGIDRMNARLKVLEQKVDTILSK